MARGSFILVEMVMEVTIKVKIIAHWINLGKLNQKDVKVPRSGRGKIILKGTFLSTYMQLHFNKLFLHLSNERLINISWK